jgi:hypothetical protein
LSGSKGNKKKIKVIIKSIKNLGTEFAKTALKQVLLKTSVVKTSVVKTSVAKTQVDNKHYVTKNFYIAKPTFS